MTQNAPKWPKYDPKWPKMVQHGPRMTQNDPKWPKNDPKWHINCIALPSSHYNKIGPCYIFDIFEGPLENIVSFQLPWMEAPGW